MNSLDFSKGDLSRARTADYFLGQSASNPTYNPHLGFSKETGQNYYDPRVYPGDASRYYQYVHPQPSQIYENYPNRLEPSQSYSLNPKIIQKDQSRIQSPQMYPNSMGMSQPIPYQYQKHLFQSQTPPHQNQPLYPKQQTYRREFLNFRPMMASQINQVPQPKYKLQDREPHHEYDFKVFCPACHQQYYNSQLEQHIENHYLYNTEQFKISNDIRPTQEDTVSQLSNQPRFYYPLIEPQEFECKELDQVNYMNKYKIDPVELNKKEATVKVKSQSTQFAKPPLQFQSHETDIYNCFDNVFSSSNKFSPKDLTSSNSIIARKRQLQDWQKLRSQKQGYQVKTK